METKIDFFTKMFVFAGFRFFYDKNKYFFGATLDMNFFVTLTYS